MSVKQESIVPMPFVRCECVCVCAYVCMYVYICMSRCHKSGCGGMYVCMYVYTYVCMHVVSS